MVFFVTLLTEGKVITLSAIVSELAFLYGLETVRFVAHKPHIKTFLFCFLVSVFNYFLFIVYVHFGFEISIYRIRNVFVLKQVQV